MRPVREMQGIFCKNYCSSQNGLPPCRSTWHAACYTYRGPTKFPMPAILDEAGNAWHKEEEQRRRMMEGVDGSHLCIPFQCKLCWYCNLEGRDPVPGQDDVYLTCICRVNINAMLGKSPLTIRAHRQDLERAVSTALTFGKMPAYHPLGPFPMVDQVGMSLAVDILLKSLVARGKLVKHVQFATL